MIGCDLKILLVRLETVYGWKTVLKLRFAVRPGKYQVYRANTHQGKGKTKLTLNLDVRDTKWCVHELLTHKYLFFLIHFNTPFFIFLFFFFFFFLQFCWCLGLCIVRVLSRLLCMDTSASSIISTTWEIFL